jgi:AraC-like DNA-binding protein
MNHASPYVLASGAEVPPQDGQALFRALDPGHRVLVMGAGEDTVLMGGHVSLDRDRGKPLAQLLPPVLRIPADNAEASRMQWLLTQLMRERAARGLGHQALTTHLAHMLFLQVLRLHLSQEAVPASSWLRVLADARLLPAIKRMHAEPGRDWQLQELALSCAMSRTSFAVRFRSVAGMTPMAYLAHWRMLLAQHALRHDARPIASWITELGYASESAFSHAFKRIVGTTPSEYRAMG